MAIGLQTECHIACGMVHWFLSVLCIRTATLYFAITGIVLQETYHSVFFLFHGSDSFRQIFGLYDSYLTEREIVVRCLQNIIFFTGSAGQIINGSHLKAERARIPCG
ncbi:MAG: hypothetical protein HY742_01770 [Deltaproteobacteria bacterium]|nr:hypothetical protein [Deltaproteobacteria bacterium]